MNRLRSLAVVLLGGVVLVGCPKGGGPPNGDLEQLKKDVEALKLKTDSLAKWLGKGDSLNVYLVSLAEAVCELEKKTPGIPNNKRICPKDPPHDIKPPPTYPPK
jgi:hypothetical protein